MTLPLLCTSSPPGGDPRTSSMHAGCHSRRMTSFSSTMPFPLLTLNCHTPHSSTSSTSFQPAGLHCFVAATTNMSTHVRPHTRGSLRLVICNQWEAARPVIISLAHAACFCWAKRVSGYNSQMQHSNTKDGDYCRRLMVIQLS